MIMTTMKTLVTSMAVIAPVSSETSWRRSLWSRTQAARAAPEPASQNLNCQKIWAEVFHHFSTPRYKTTWLATTSFTRLLRRFLKGPDADPWRSLSGADEADRSREYSLLWCPPCSPCLSPWSPWSPWCPWCSPWLPWSPWWSPSWCWLKGKVLRRDFSKRGSSSPSTTFASCSSWSSSTLAAFAPLASSVDNMLSIGFRLKRTAALSSESVSLFSRISFISFMSCISSSCLASRDTRVVLASTRHGSRAEKSAAWILKSVFFGSFWFESYM